MNRKNIFQIGIVVVVVLGMAVALYLTQFTQIFSPKAAESGGTGQISVSPDPCLIPSGQSLCSVVVTWSSSNAVQPVEVRIRDTPKTLFAAGPSGSQTASFVTGYGVTFDLYENNGTRLLASVFAKGGINTGTITASPYPCIIPAGQTTCITTATWSAEFIKDPVQVKVRETGVIWATGHSGTVDITVGFTPQTLDLYHDNGRFLLSSYIIKGIPGTVSVSPSPNVTPSSTAKVGDLNNDGRVNIFDFNIFVQHYQTRNAIADLNKNGTVDIFDFNLLVSNFGR